MSSGHAPIAPSGLARLIQCPGSLLMEAMYPETEQTPEAADGEASHWALAEMLAGREPRIGQAAPNGVFLTQEMLEGADLCFDDVVKTAAAHGVPMDQVIVEVPVSIGRIHAQCWGTPDVRMWAPGKLLFVWDYKFGYRYVPVFENPQVMAYTAGSISQTNLSDLEVNVVNRIVQPRSYHKSGPVREWRYNASAIRAHINIANAAAHEALGPNPKTRVGPECRDCRARHACPTLLRAAEDACNVAGQAQPMDLPPEALGVELRYLQRSMALLKARISGLEEQALALIRQGKRVPHFVVDRSAGRQVWKKPDAEVITLGQMLGVNLAKPSEAITPAQALAAGLQAELLPMYAEKRPGAATLTPDDGSDLRQIFS